MGDGGQRRRPPLRSDRERMESRPRTKSPEPAYSYLEDERYQEESKKEEDREERVLSMLMESWSLDSETLGSNLKDVVDYFETLNSPSARRQFVLTTFAMALEDREFSKCAGALYGMMHTIKIGDDTVRSLLLSAIQKELNDNDYRVGNRQRFLNAVFLLSEMYYHIRFDDHPITVLGGELLKYFRWLLTGDEKEFEVLTTCMIVNGSVLRKDKPVSYRKLIMEIRPAMVARNMSAVSRSWLILLGDMDLVNFDGLPDDLLMYHMTTIGYEGFKKFRRVRPTVISSPSNKISNVRQVTSDKRISLSKPRSPKQSPERRPSDRRVSQQSPDEWQVRERLSCDAQLSSSSQHSCDDWESPERHSSSDRLSPKLYSSNNWESSEKPNSLDRRQSFDSSQRQYDSHKTSSKVPQKRTDNQNRPQRTPSVPNYTGRPLKGSLCKRNMELWTEPPSTVHTTFKKADKKIPVWQHEHDDRFDHDYNN